MSADYSSLASKVGYGIGRNIGEQLRQNPPKELDLNALYAGIQEAFDGKESAVSQEELQAAFQEMNDAQVKELRAEGDKFLAENAKREEVIVTESGLQYEVLATGEGDKPTRESKVRTHYHGTLINGDVFDSSYERGQPAEFPVGGVIAGWTEALQMMSVGSKWRLYVPFNLAYGEQGAGGKIGPFSTLIFDVELLDIVA